MSAGLTSTNEVAMLLFAVAGFFAQNASESWLYTIASFPIAYLTSFLALSEGCHDKTVVMRFSFIPASFVTAWYSFMMVCSFMKHPIFYRMHIWLGNAYICPLIGAVIMWSGIAIAAVSISAACPK
jgi:hypothetical protein